VLVRDSQELNRNIAKSWSWQMIISRWAVLSSLIAVSISWQSTPAAPIGMPAGSKVWMKFEGGACPDADGDDCAGSNRAGPNPPNGIPMSTFSGSTGLITGYAEILPDRIRTLNRGDAVAGVHGGGSGFMHASFEDTYTVGGTAAGPFDISVALHVTGFARSAGTGTSSISHQMVGVNGEAKIGTFQTFTDPALGEGLRVSEFSAATRANFSFATEAAGSPFEHPIDVTANHTVLNVNVGDTFVLAYGVNSRFSRGQVDFLDTGMISFDLPEGVFLTSSLAATLAGDYNLDHNVDAADYVVWRKNDGSQEGYDTWRANFGLTVGSGAASAAPFDTTVPEPSNLVLVIFLVVNLCIRRGQAA
jgi:hypothetical protein